MSVFPGSRRLTPALYIVLLVSSVGGFAQQRPGLFVDVTAESGLDFTHINGATGELLLPEVIGAGGAVFDYDNDGDLDIFAVQGAALRPQPGSAIQPRSRLFRNDLVRGSARLRFTDVTDRSGLGITSYGMGAATGDYDNDGWIDLFVTTLDADRLFRNNGDGTFTDVTSKAGTSDPQWSTSASFVDIDRDGWLDLYVANYVSFGADMKRACFSAGSARDYCNPAVYEPAPDTLFRNNRDGTFTDVSKRAGISQNPGRGLGVLGADVNGDGWTDLYVANDGDPNQLFINVKGSSFTDEGLLAGVALGRNGLAQGSMGIDYADIDADGDDDFVVTNLDNESNTMYLNVGRGLFEDRTVEMGVFRLGITGFGTRFVDVDNDSWLDLVVVNGAVRHLLNQVQRGESYPLKQSKLFFRNQKGRRFVDATSEAGPAFDRQEVSRGLSLGDLDNDGDSDLVVFNNSGPARVLVNQAAAGKHWVGVRVLDPSQRRDAVHTRVELVRRGVSLWRRVHTDGSYAAASDPRVIFGLASEQAPQTIRVHWIGGSVEEFRDLAVDRYWVLERGRPPRAM